MAFSKIRKLHLRSTGSSLREVSVYNDTGHFQNICHYQGMKLVEIGMIPVDKEKKKLFFLRERKERCYTCSEHHPVPFLHVNLMK